MSRNYTVMREILSHVVKAKAPLELDDLDWVEPRDRVRGELRRLKRDGIIDGDVEFGRDGSCKSCIVTGLTDEGREFWRLIECDAVWSIVLGVVRLHDRLASHQQTKNNRTGPVRGHFCRGGAAMSEQMTLADESGERRAFVGEFRPKGKWENMPVAD